MSSPYEKMGTKSFDVSANKHPVREEIQKCLGVYEFTAEFKEDKATLETFEHVPGLIAFICTIKKDGKTIGVGRGQASINRINRYVERNVHTAFNNALVDCVYRAARVLNSFYPNANSESKGLDVALPDAYLAKAGYGLEPITGKQKAYLRELVRAKITDKDELRHWEAKIDEFDKAAASEAIKIFKR